MKDQIREDRTILAAAERRLAAWSMKEHATGKAQKASEAAATTSAAIRFVCISRESGAGGSEIGRRLGERLDWEVLDRKLLDCVADGARVSRPMLEMVDETTGHWAEDLFAPWIDPALVPREKYVRHLSRVIRSAATQGRVVFVGRGAQFFVPAPGGLAVRLVSSVRERARRTAQSRGLSQGAAQRYNEEIDHGRRDFIARFFHRDIADPGLYDIVLNVDRLGIDRCVDHIAYAVRSG